MSKGGHNFEQLLCLVHAILAQPKIMILDGDNLSCGHENQQAYPAIHPGGTLTHMSTLLTN